MINNEDSIHTIDEQVTPEHDNEAIFKKQETIHLDRESLQNVTQIQSTSPWAKGWEPFLLVDDNPINLKVFRIYFKIKHVSKFSDV